MLTQYLVNIGIAWIVSHVQLPYMLSHICDQSYTKTVPSCIFQKMRYIVKENKHTTSNGQTIRNYRYSNQIISLYY